MFNIKPSSNFQPQLFQNNEFQVFGLRSFSFDVTKIGLKIFNTFLDENVKKKRWSYRQ